MKQFAFAVACVLLVASPVFADEPLAGESRVMPDTHVPGQVHRPSVMVVMTRRRSTSLETELRRSFTDEIVRDAASTP
jgi:hypothetical protein